MIILRYHLYFPFHHFINPNTSLEIKIASNLNYIRSTEPIISCIQKMKPTKILKSSFLRTRFSWFNYLSFSCFKILCVGCRLLKLKTRCCPLACKSHAHHLIDLPAKLSWRLGLHNWKKFKYTKTISRYSITIKQSCTVTFFRGSVSGRLA